MVLGLLVWQFQGLQFARGDAAEGDRYLDDIALRPGLARGERLPGLMASVCHSLQLPDRVQWLWRNACRDSKPKKSIDPREMPLVLQTEYEGLQAAVSQGLEERHRRIAPLAKSDAEGVLPADQLALLKATWREIVAYRSYYQIANHGPVLSVPLQCAWQELMGRIGSASDDGTRAVTLATATALLTGRAERLWLPPTLPSGPQASGELGWSAVADPACVALGPAREVLAHAARLAQRVRVGEQLERKAYAMQRLHLRAPWLLAGWSILLWVCLALVRVTDRPGRYLGLVLVLWAVAGGASGLVWPTSGQAVPWWAWGTMASVGAGWMAWGRLPAWASGPQPDRPWRKVSGTSLPLWVLFVGFGWWLAFDLAINGHVRNRYIALAQQLPLFTAFLLMAAMPALAGGIARAWIAWSGLITNALRPSATGSWRGWLRPAVLWTVYLLTLAALALLTRNWRQFTGEAFRWWLVMGVAWFFLLRAGRWAQPTRAGWTWLGTSLLPLLMHLAAVMLALLVTDDLGPILVVLLSGSVYAGAFIAQAAFGRGAHWALAASTGMLSALAVSTVLLSGMLAFSKLPWGPAERVAQRLESVFDPYSAENDQLAHVEWFRKHIPAAGYGLGATPWCGTLPSGNCRGMPAQTQSDYTYTAVQGVLGEPGALGLLAVYLLWMGWLAARQAAQTDGLLQPARPGATEAGWLAWLAVCWAVMVVVQTLVTVLGNLGALPLTGVTWPFVSWGTWSLLMNTAVLGLVMHRLEVQP